MRFAGNTIFWTLPALLVVCTASVSHCATVFLGPTPYLSEADSPFDLSGLGSTFYLEDFEDGELNTPGISHPNHPVSHAQVAPPSSFTDSVDGDAGPIDGDGTSGHSLASVAYISVPIDPPVTTWFISFAFDRDELGYLPNAFGFVWTDGVQDSIATIELFDEDFNIFATHKYSGFFGDEVFSGTTPEDRFLGVVSDQEIFWVQIRSQHSGSNPPLEIDHVQYGLVPEPSGVVLLVLGLLAFVCVVHRSTRRTAADHH